MMRRLTEMPRDSGAGMVIVLAAIFLTAMMTTTILASTIFSVRHTTATRANVEAVAAAEAGAQIVAQGLRTAPLGFECAGSYASPSDPTYSGPAYDAEVSYIPKGEDPDPDNWIQGCPPPDVEQLKVVATGYAQSKGVSNSSRDTAVTEVIFTRPPAVPLFNKALFGDLNINVNTGIDVVQGPGTTSADLFTYGNYTCSTQATIEGSLYIGGDATFSSEPCTIEGNLYSEGDFRCSAGTEILGDVFVQGNVFFNGRCNIRGGLWAGGNINIEHGGGRTEIGRDVIARKDATFNPHPNAGGTFHAGGSIVIKGDDTRASFFAAYPDATEHDSSVGLPPQIPQEAKDPFPKILEDGRVGKVGSNTYSEEGIWDGWASGNWKAAVEAASGNPYANHCSPWGASFPNAIVINSDTVMDTRSTCGGGIILTPKMSIELNADLVILANSVGVGEGDPIEVYSGDGEEHNIYVVVPWPAGQVSCQGSPEKISLTGNWRQDNRVRAMFYSPADLKVNGGPKIRGQLYGCQVSAHTSFEIEFVPIGDLAADDTLKGLNFRYLRDVTD